MFLGPWPLLWTKRKLNKHATSYYPHYWHSARNLGGISYFSFFYKPKVKNLWFVGQTMLGGGGGIYTRIGRQKDAASRHFYKIHGWPILRIWWHWACILAWKQSAGTEWRLLPLPGFVFSALPQFPPLPIVYLTLGFSLGWDLLFIKAIRPL